MADTLGQTQMSSPTSISAPIGFSEQHGYNEIGVKLIRQTFGRNLYYSVKRIRNQLTKKVYQAKRAKGTEKFLNRLSKISVDSIFFTVAYNTPWTIKLMISFWHKNCRNLHLAVIDNSSDPASAEEIRNICSTANISYLKLPKNNAGHMCRSHGFAINWIWKNLVCRTPNLNIIGLIDHDCFPIKPWDLSSKPNVFAYGAKNPGYIQGVHTWNMWAGFMIFDMGRSPVNKRKMDFTVNPLDTLDTGGMNWRIVYRNLSTDQYSFAKVERIQLNLKDGNKGPLSTIEVEIVDDSLLHLGGLTHKKLWNQQNVEEALASFRNQQLSTDRQA